MRYELQVNDWTDWEAVESFDDEACAKLFARETYAQNEWRIYDRVSQRVVHQHDPSEVFSQLAMADLDRFERVDNWTRRIAQRRRRELNRPIRRRILNALRVSELMSCFGSKTDKVNWIKEGF